MSVITDAERVELARAIAESDIAGCSLENEDIDALVDLLEAWLERRAPADTETVTRLREALARGDERFCAALQPKAELEQEKS